MTASLVGGEEDGGTPKASATNAFLLVASPLGADPLSRPAKMASQSLSLGAVEGAFARAGLALVAVGEAVKSPKPLPCAEVLDADALSKPPLKSSLVEIGRASCRERVF